MPAISKYLKNAFEERELDKKVIVSRIEITTLGKMWILRLRRALRRMTCLGGMRGDLPAVILREVAEPTLTFP